MFHCPTGYLVGHGCARRPCICGNTQSVQSVKRTDSAVTLETTELMSSRFHIPLLQCRSQPKLTPALPKYEMLNGSSADAGPRFWAFLVPWMLSIQPKAILPRASWLLLQQSSSRRQRLDRPACALKLFPMCIRLVLECRLYASALLATSVTSSKHGDQCSQTEVPKKACRAKTLRRKE